MSDGKKTASTSRATVENYCLHERVVKKGVNPRARVEEIFHPGLAIAVTDSLGTLFLIQCPSNWHNY